MESMYQIITAEASYSCPYNKQQRSLSYHQSTQNLPSARSSSAPPLQKSISTPTLRLFLHIHPPSHRGSPFSPGFSHYCVTIPASLRALIISTPHLPRTNNLLVSPPHPSHLNAVPKPNWVSFTRHPAAMTVLGGFPPLLIRNSHIQHVSEHYTRGII